MTVGVVMGSPLGPIIGNIFMVNLEKCLVPTLKHQHSYWKRYVTIMFITVGSTEHVLSLLNSFHSSIKFTYETGCN